MSAEKSSPYTGKLNEPLPRIRPPGGLFPERREAELSAIKQLVREKFNLLFQHYGIDVRDDQRWTALTIELAFDHVPGFQIGEPETRGRKPVWSIGEKIRLLDSVTTLVTKGHSARGACHILAKREPYKSRGEKPATLSRRYYEIKNMMKERPDFIRVLREMAAEGLLDDPPRAEKED